MLGKTVLFHDNGQEYVALVVRVHDDGKLNLQCFYPGASGFFHVAAVSQGTRAGQWSPLP